MEKQDTALDEFATFLSVLAEADVEYQRVRQSSVLGKRPAKDLRYIFNEILKAKDMKRDGVNFKTSSSSSLARICRVVASAMWDSNSSDESEEDTEHAEEQNEQHGDADEKESESHQCSKEHGDAEEHNEEHASDDECAFRPYMCDDNNDDYKGTDDEENGLEDDAGDAKLQVQTEPIADRWEDDAHDESEDSSLSSFTDEDSI